MGKRRQGLINVRSRSHGIVIAFSAEEWRALGELMDKALAVAELQPPWRIRCWPTARFEVRPSRASSGSLAVAGRCVTGAICCRLGGETMDLDSTKASAILLD